MVLKINLSRPWL